ncbi:hypothetical protein GOC76_30045 [Sinorhizobium medicae]|nr:hypothetical protein [Sinorhizobium medicae]
MSVIYKGGYMRNSAESKIICVPLMTLIFLTSCITDDTNSAPSGWANALGRSTQFLCGFVPAAADLGALFEVTGAGKVKQASKIICDAVDKKRAELAQVSTISPPSTPEEAAQQREASVPVGTSIVVEIQGKRISGLTTR